MKVGHLNAHNRVEAIHYMLRQGCDSLGFDEAAKRLGLLKERDRMRLTVGPGVRAATPILTRDAYPDLGRIALQASEAAKPERLAPPRWVTVSCFRHPDLGQLAHVNAHPHPMTDDRPLSVDRVRETAEYWGTVSRLLVFLRQEGFRRILTGDVNARPGGDSEGFAGAYDVLRAARLDYVHEGLDVIAFERTLHPTHTRVIPREATGSDHPGLIVELDGKVS